MNAVTDSYDALIRRLTRPSHPVDAVLDTDAYNEADDQFAIAYLLRSDDRVTTRAIYAAPFYASFNPNSVSPEDGMEKSYHEILRVTDLAGRGDMAAHVFRGAKTFMKNEATPVDCPAARDLAVRAMSYTPSEPLYVLCIGAITNVASAFLMQPAIRDRVVIVWLGGNALDWPDNFEFNMMQDVAAARVIMGSGAAVVQLPCYGVVDHLITSKPELDTWLSGRNALCDHLLSGAMRDFLSCLTARPWSRVLWDVAVVAWLTDFEQTRVMDRLMPAPIPQYDFHYSLSPSRHPIRHVWKLERDAIFEDLFARLTRED